MTAIPFQGEECATQHRPFRASNSIIALRRKKYRRDKKIECGNSSTPRKGQSIKKYSNVAWKRVTDIWSSLRKIYSKYPVKSAGRLQAGEAEGVRPGG